MRDKPDLARDRSEKIVISWQELNKIDYRVSPGFCDWITFDSIRECIESGYFEDARIPQSKLSHHAARIAWLVRHLRDGGSVDPIHIHVNHRKAYIFDGSHRLRAFQFLGLDGSIDSIVTGRTDVLNEYIQSNPERRLA